MKLVELALELSNIPAEINPKRYLGMRKKIARGIWRVWNESKAAQNAMACYCVFVGDFKIDVLGKREGMNCRLSIARAAENGLRITCDTQADPFSDAEWLAIRRILFYNIPANFSGKRAEGEKIRNNKRIYVNHIETVNGKYVSRLPITKEYAALPDKTPRNFHALSRIEITYNVRNGTTAITQLYNG